MKLQTEATFFFLKVITVFSFAIESTSKEENKLRK